MVSFSFIDLFFFLSFHPLFFRSVPVHTPARTHTHRHVPAAGATPTPTHLHTHTNTFVYLYICLYSYTCTRAQACIMREFGGCKIKIYMRIGKWAYRGVNRQGKRDVERKTETGRGRGRDR